MADQPTTTLSNGQQVPIGQAWNQDDARLFELQRLSGYCVNGGLLALTVIGFVRDGKTLRKISRSFVPQDERLLAELMAQLQYHLQQATGRWAEAFMKAQEKQQARDEIAAEEEAKAQKEDALASQRWAAEQRQKAEAAAEAQSAAEEPPKQ